MGRLRRTPLHPQWLLARRDPPDWLASSHGVVLDVGAADRWVERHVPHVARYVALDYPDTATAMYRSKPDVFGDGCRLPVSDTCVDSLICLEVMEHVRVPGALLDEAERVLIPGGMLWLSVPFMYPIHDAPHDYRRYTEHGLRLLFSERQFEVLSLRGHGHCIRSAGLVSCLALAGPLQRSMAYKRIPLMLLAACLIPLVNCIAWLLSLAWPTWDAMPMVYEVQARKR